MFRLRFSGNKVRPAVVARVVAFLRQRHPDVPPMPVSPPPPSESGPSSPGLSKEAKDRVLKEFKRLMMDRPDLVSLTNPEDAPPMPASRATSERALVVAALELERLVKEGVVSTGSVRGLHLRDGDSWEAGLQKPHPYNAPTPDFPAGYWIVYVEDIHFGTMLKSSTIMAVSKATLSVDFFGSAEDEG